ncbi:MAG: type II toxin-antitoxin system VapC family toxin [Candidatus Binatia bacterium]
MALLLLDTCALVWWMADAADLSAKARRAISSRSNDVLVSAVSLWEIAIKTRRGRLLGTEEYLARYSQLHEEWGFATVVIEAADAVAAGTLPIAHEDPFDRMLLAQAKRLHASIVTCDDAIRSRHARTVW